MKTSLKIVPPVAEDPIARHMADLQASVDAHTLSLLEALAEAGRLAEIANSPAFPPGVANLARQISAQMNHYCNTLKAIQGRQL